MAKDNPFRYGSPVEGDYYYQRPTQQEACASLLRNHISVMLIGPRRFGKTSFAKQLCSKWAEEKRGDALLVEVFNVTSHQDFLIQLLKAVQEKEKWLKRFIRKAKELFPDNITLSHEHIGSMKLEWIGKTEAEKKFLVLQALESLTELEGHICLVIDECQQLSKEALGDKGWLEATLRQAMQQHAGKIVFLLTGSRRDIANTMVNDSKRPLYRACQVMDFPPLDEGFNDWVANRLKAVGFQADREIVAYLREMVDDSPNYVQMVCYNLVATGCVHVDREAINEVLSSIITQNTYSYETLLYSLTSAQQRILRMVAIEEEGLFSASVLARYEINSPAHATNAIKALKKRNILDHEPRGRGRVDFDDPFFKIWLQHKFGNRETSQLKLL